MPTQRSFVDEVPELLARHQMTLRSLARDVGVNVSHLSRVLRGSNQQTPSGDLARRVANAFGLPDDYFPEYREAAVIAHLKKDAETRDRLYRRYARPRPN